MGLPTGLATTMTMMDRLQLLAYRLYFAFKTSATKGVLRRYPRAVRGLDRIKGLVRRHLFPKQVWVRIQAGLSQGMWMQVCLPSDASLWRGEHDAAVQNAISALVRSGAVVYDVGAHVGIMSLGAARLVGDLGRVVAFDGDPENVERLRANAAKNGLEGRLRVVNAAVWSRSTGDGIPFRRGRVGRSHGGVEADGHRPVLGDGEIVSVPAITLDDFIAAGGPPPQLIKIDVEGGEYEVLRGGARLFTTQRPFIIVEVHHQQAAELIVAWLDQHQYCRNWDIPEEKFPRVLFAWPSDQDGEARMQARLIKPGSRGG
jgi:FkbM family methyltransferase